MAAGRARTVRLATPVDRDALRALWSEFSAAAPPPPWILEAQEGSFRGIDDAIAAGTAFVAEDDGVVVGFAAGLPQSPLVGELTELYVRPATRRAGLATMLVRAVVAALRERGAEALAVSTAVDNHGALRLYERAGFRRESLTLVAPAAVVEERLGSERVAASFGSIHVQTDDRPAVERAVRDFVPRLPGRSRGSLVVGPRAGWIAVYDDVCDRDPKQLRRLAREISERMGTVVLMIGIESGAVVHYVLFERGIDVDEYMSVPEHAGPRPPGEVVALAANPRLVARLTGADPVAVRAAALQGALATELPPPPEVLAHLARALGIEGAEHGYADAPEIAGAVRLER